MKNKTPVSFPGVKAGKVINRDFVINDHFNLYNYTGRKGRLKKDPGRGGGNGA